MPSIYEDGRYLDSNPNWHEEDSPWKAAQVARMIARNNLRPSTVCEIGCGTGEVLHQLVLRMDNGVNFVGYDISPQAIGRANKKESDRLRFRLKDLFEEPTTGFDIVLAIDVLEHVEDYMGFLRKLKPTGEYKILHIPLELSAQAVLRSKPILSARRKVGHLHYFSKDTALATLRDTGYEVLDHFYTCGSFELPSRRWTLKVMRIPRKLFFSVSQEMTARVLGGFSLLVLAR
jgi:2-polyprenyl-3-methyl-5-hydroxy-6-metoxy-1,4-benzoquinol methylase